MRRGPACKLLACSGQAVVRRTPSTSLYTSRGRAAIPEIVRSFDNPYSARIPKNHKDSPNGHHLRHHQEPATTQESTKDLPENYLESPKTTPNPVIMPISGFRPLLGNPGESG